MAKQVEFFFDVVSPASYLAWTQIEKLVADTGAEVKYRPFFLPGLFEKAGSSSPITVPAKGNWLFQDLKRHAHMYDVPFKMNSRFPMNSLYAMRGLIAYQDTDHIKKLGDGFFAAMWANDEDINDPNVMKKIVEAADIDPAEYQSKIADPAIKQAVFDVTEEAASRGMFGAPTFFVGDEMHWGQDRLDFVRETLNRN